jgi:RND family efflux transporter MFP subunit
MDITKLAPGGSMVRKGDVVAVLDPTNMQNRIDDETDELREEETKVRKLKVQQELDMVNLVQSLRIAKSEYDKAVLELKAQEVRTAVDQELLKLSADEAEASYKELQRDVEQKKIAQKAELRIQEISYDLQKKNVERYNRDLERLTLITPIDGLVVMMSQNRPGGDQVTYGEGDRVQPGMPFMKIVNPASMQVEGTINQAESSSFRIGQMATIGLDAFPGASYEGKVYAIGALATGGFRQNYYIRSVPVRVQVQNPDKRMIPDLSASADILLGRAENVLAVPAAALHREKGKDVVYVKGPKSFEPREVKIGLHNGIQAEVLEGLKEGDQVRIN